MEQYSFNIIWEIESTILKFNSLNSIIIVWYLDIYNLNTTKFRKLHLVLSLLLLKILVQKIMQILYFKKYAKLFIIVKLFQNYSTFCLILNYYLLWMINDTGFYSYLNIFGKLDILFNSYVILI